MCYKDEVQRKNMETLNRRLNEAGAPMFIRRYFVNIDSKDGCLKYWIAIKDLLEWLIEEKRIEKDDIRNLAPEDFRAVTSEDIKEFLVCRESSGRLSPRTLVMRRAIYQGFWGYLVRTEAIPVRVNVVTGVNYKCKSNGLNLYMKLPSELELATMKMKIMKKNDEFTRKRNIAIFTVLKGTGLRECELAGLDMEDLHIDPEDPEAKRLGGTFIRILGKGRYRKEYESRVVFVGKPVRDVLNEWIKYRDTNEKCKNSPALFVGKYGNRFTEPRIKDMFDTYGGGITPHMIRHWYATQLANANEFILAQQQLGHASGSVTQDNYVAGIAGKMSVLDNLFSVS